MVAIEVAVVRVVVVQVYKVKRVVVNIHAAFGDIGDVEVPLTTDQGAGQARVDRAVGGLDHGYSMGGGRRCSIRQGDVGVPCGDGPVERGKDEIGCSARRQVENCFVFHGHGTRGGTERA